MGPRTHDRQHPAKASRKFVRIHAPDIVALPEPGDEWKMTDVDLDATVWRKFKAEGVIRVVRRRPSNRTHTWETDPRCYEMAEEVLDDRDALPCCGATGIVNDAGTIRCKRCGSAHDRDTAKEVLG